MTQELGSAWRCARGEGRKGRGLEPLVTAPWATNPAKTSCLNLSGMNERQSGLGSVGFSAGEELLRQCVNVDRVGCWGFSRPEWRDFADQAVAQKLLQCQ